MYSGALAIALLCVPACLLAQAVEAPPSGLVPGPVVANAETAKNVAPGSACDLCVPALTPVDLILDADLGSKISKTGDVFAFHLAKPIVVGGREIVPVGTQGQGEVVHAKKAGGSGTAGELVVAARFLVVGTQLLRLRSLRLEQQAHDAVGKIDAFNAATVMSPVPVALLGFAITGRNAFFPKGATAFAKTAALFVPSDGQPGSLPDNQPHTLANPPEGVH